MGGIRIESDGTPHGTKIIDIYTGERLNNVIALDVNINLDEILATITVLPDEIVMTIPEDNVVIKEEDMKDEITEESD